MLKFILSTISIYILTISIANSRDVQILNSTLLNQTFYTPDYVMVVKGKNRNNQEDSKIMKDLDSSLETIGQRFSSLGQDRKNQYVSKIFAPNTAFKVVQIFQNKPSFSRSIFNEPYHFAVLERDGEKYIFAPILSKDTLDWNIMKCQHECKNWRETLKECLEKFNGKNCLVNYEIYLRDENNMMINKNKAARPLSKTLVDKNLKGFLNYAKDRKDMDNIINRNHLFVTSKLSALEFSNSILHFEELNVEYASPSSTNISWEEFKRINN